MHYFASCADLQGGVFDSHGANTGTFTWVAIVQAGCKGRGVQLSDHG